VKYGLLTILVLWTINLSLGQAVEKILLVSQERDEPPTKPAPAKYTLAFEINPDGDFIATQVKRDNKRRKLSEVATIEKERMDKIDGWNNVNKSNFTILDLGIDRKTIELTADDSGYKLNFELPDQIVLDVDSFHFCQNYKTTKSISTGGERISVTMLAKSQPPALFTFNSNDIGTGEFKLKEYIFCYSILNERIPDQFQHFNFFSKGKLSEIVVYYQKTVECEGFYYEEYADKNQLTDKERRMKEGWDFVRYMKQRVRQ
jgi:hypothetical protein